MKIRNTLIACASVISLTACFNQACLPAARAPLSLPFPEVDDVKPFEWESAKIQEKPVLYLDLAGFDALQDDLLILQHAVAEYKMRLQAYREYYEEGKNATDGSGKGN